MATPTILLAIAAITTSPQITAEQVPIRHTADGGEAQVMRTPAIGEVVALLVVVSGCEVPTDVPVTLVDRLVVLPEEADPTTTAVIGPIADTYLRRDRPNQNRGSVEFLRVRSGGDNRTLIQFDHGAIEDAVGSGSLEGAMLELTITRNGNNGGAAAGVSPCTA